jgi:hypothetical protein
MKIMMNSISNKGSIVFTKVSFSRKLMNNLLSYYLLLIIENHNYNPPLAVICVPVHVALDKGIRRKVIIIIINSSVGIEAK